MVAGLRDTISAAERQRLVDEAIEADAADLLGWDDSRPASVEAGLVLGTVVGELSERERRLLQWRLVDEHTQQEIADLVGLTQAQVSRILTRVLARLRAGLTEPLPAT